MAGQGTTDGKKLDLRTRGGRCDDVVVLWGDEKDVRDVRRTVALVSVCPLAVHCLLTLHSQAATNFVDLADLQRGEPILFFFLLLLTQSRCGAYFLSKTNRTASPICNAFRHDYLKADEFLTRWVGPFLSPLYYSSH